MDQSREEISGTPFSRDAIFYLNFLLTELSLTHHYGSKRSIDPVRCEEGLFLSAFSRNAGSGRAARSIKQYAKAIAWFDGREEVEVQDVVRVAPYTLWHRMQWTSDIVNALAQDRRCVPLGLHIGQTLVGKGTEEYKGVESRFEEVGEVYGQVIDLICVGEETKAREIAQEQVKDGKGHPLFGDTIKDISCESAHLLAFAARFGDDEFVYERDDPTSFDLVEARSYGRALKRLSTKRRLHRSHQNGSGKVALGFADTLKVLVGSYGADTIADVRRKVLQKGVETYSALIHGVDEDKFKIIQCATPLGTMKRDDGFPQIGYGDVVSGEIAYQDRGFEALSKQEVLQNKILLALCNQDQFLLGDFFDWYAHESGQSKGLGLALGEMKEGVVHPVYISSMANECRIVASCDSKTPTGFIAAYGKRN